MDTHGIEEVVSQLVDILRPLKGTGEKEFEYDEFYQDDPIREAVKQALVILNVDGLGGCRLCAS